MFSCLSLLLLAAMLSSGPCRADTVVEALAGADSFQGLNAAELAAVAALGTVVAHKAGAEFITYGVSMNRLFVVQAGKAKVILKTGTIVAVVGPGTTLGEMEFVDGQPASATVVVTEDAKMVEFAPAALRGLLQRRPAIGYRVMGNMAKKISLQLRKRE